MFAEGLPVHIRDEHGNTLLIVAAQNNQLKAAKLCWRQGVDPNATNVRGGRAPRNARAAALPHTHCDPCARLQARGRTALDCAVQLQFTEVAEFLLEVGAGSGVFE